MNNPHQPPQPNSSLGRGLSSLIPNRSAGQGLSGNARTNKPISPASYFPKTQSGVKNQVLHVPPTSIAVNPYQPRQKFRATALEGLKNSIREHGILQPLVVTQTMAGKYELLAGERRLRAARELNLRSVPVIVRAAKDMEKLELSLIENIQREDLNPIERARAYKQLIENFNLTQEEASKRLGIPRSTLNNTLRLLNLSADVQLGLAGGSISEGQAKLILSVNDTKEQERIFHQAEENKLTVKDIEREVRKVKVKSHVRVSGKDPRLKKWESDLSSALGTRVNIRHRGQNGGVIEIEFYSDEELAGIIENINQG